MSVVISSYLCPSVLAMLSYGIDCCRYLAKIQAEVNDTIGIQIIDKDHWPVPEWAPSNVTDVFYVPPGTLSTSNMHTIGYFGVSSVVCLYSCSCKYDNWWAGRVPIHQHPSGVHHLILRTRCWLQKQCVSRRCLVLLLCGFKCRFVVFCLVR